MEKKIITSTELKLDVPKDKINIYRDAFNMFDKKKKGTINAKDIYNLLKNYGYPITKDEVRKIVEKIDANIAGVVVNRTSPTKRGKYSNYYE